MPNPSRYTRPNRIVVLVLLALITLNLVALNPSGVSAAEGDLDATFGTGDASVPAGVARTFFGANPSAANDTAKRVAIQSTGKIVAAGRTNFQFALARYNANGTLDTGFGSSGKITEAQFGPGGDTLNDMAVDSNDRIITIGLASGLGSCSSGLSSPADWAIAVYTANGILDTTFNLTGKRTIDYFGCSDSANAVVVQPDNKIVIIGTATEPVSGGSLVRYVVLVRLNPNGTFDSSFNGGDIGNTTGVVKVDQAIFNGLFDEMALSASGPNAGKFIAVGTGGGNFLVGRFNTNGSLDSTFGSGTGFVTTSFGSGVNSQGISVALYSDGRILAGGSSDSGNDFAMARYASDGTLDIANFGTSGTGGKVVTDFGSGNDGATFVGLMASGKLVLSGGTSASSIPQIGIARYNSNGTLDSAFGVSGKVITHLGQNGVNDNLEGVHGGLLQPDGKILTAGTISTSGQSDADFFVARFQNTDIVPTTTTITNASPSSPSTFGQQVTFTATVTPSTSPLATGTVTFKDGATTLGTGTLSNVGGVATATFQTSATQLAVGVHTITAVYAGDSGHGASTSADFSYTVNKAATTTTVTNASPASPSTFGTAVQFTATVTPNQGAILPTGTVTFKDGAATLGSGTLSNVGGVATATFTTSATQLTGGAHTITAVYGADSNYNGSTSGNFSYTVNAAATTTTVTNASPASPSTFGTAVQFTATVTPNQGAVLPTGTVTFKDGAATLGSGTLSNVGGVATATFTTSATQLTGGAHTITAVYGGDSNYNGSTSANFSYTVNKAATTSAVSSSVNPSLPGESVTFTVTVSSTAGTPTGTVQFKIDGSNAGAPVALNGSGVAQMTTSSLTAAGSPHAITADYGGDGNFNVSTGTLSGGQTVTNSALVSFSNSNYAVSESAGFLTITVNRAGDASAPVSVDYTTNDPGTPTNCAPSGGNTLASSRCDFEIALGTLNFAASETSKTFVVLINRDSFTEGSETFSVALSNPTGGSLLTTPSNSTVTITDDNSGLPSNAIDDSSAFVRQQYHDFLNREPDAAGLAFWTDNIDKCNDNLRRPPGLTVAQCIEVMRINTSGAFFLSIEFQNTGGLVRSFYVAALDRPATNGMPDYLEFERDTQAMQRGVIVDPSNNAWQTVLANNRDAFTKDFVMRPEFVGLYPTVDSPTTYVNKIYQHGLSRPPTAAELAGAVGEFPSGASQASDIGGRARALLRVTQASDFQQREMNRAFVHMQYLGYLRRNPNDAPDSDFSGYNFWLMKLNAFNGNFVNAEMVKAFISSGEYRRRFGP